MEIINKSTIMSEINQTLKTDKNPCVEYIMTRAFGLYKLPFNLGSINYNPYGHSALRYTTPDGKDIVVNVEAKENGKSMFRIYSAEDYFYSTDPTKSGAQRGVYSRDYIGLRVEDVNTEDIKQMHDYIQKLIIEDQTHNIRFNLFVGPFLNMIKHYYPNFPEYGNCARWTSAMLLKAKLITTYYVFPKTVFINMFENYSKTHIKQLSNMKVVYYIQPKNINPPYGTIAKPIWFESIAPFQTMRNIFYHDLKKFADCIVEIEIINNHHKAICKYQPNAIKPSNIRNILNNKYLIIGSVGLSIIGSVMIGRHTLKFTKQITKQFIKKYIHPKK